MDLEFCIEALEEALALQGRPEIFNTYQGSQFTSLRFTEVLIQAGVQVSMDGRGRWMHNVFIEQLWRSLKYECVYRPRTSRRVRLGPVRRIVMVLRWLPIGKTGNVRIEVSQLAALPGVTDTLIETIRTGELDTQLAGAAAERKKMFNRRTRLFNPHDWPD